MDIQTSTQIDFVLFQGFDLIDDNDKTIGIYISRNNSINHTQIY